MCVCQRRVVANTTHEGTHVEGGDHPGDVDGGAAPLVALIAGAGPERGVADGVAGHDVHVEVVHVLPVHEVPEGQAVLARAHVGRHQARLVPVAAIAGRLDVHVVASWRGGGEKIENRDDC